MVGAGGKKKKKAKANTEGKDVKLTNQMLALNLDPVRTVKFCFPPQFNYNGKGTGKGEPLNTSISRDDIQMMLAFISGVDSVRTGITGWYQSRNNMELYVEFAENTSRAIWNGGDRSSRKYMEK